jgi:hypothetical protein
MVLDQARVNTFNLVGTNRSAHAATANCQTSLHFSGRYGPCQRYDKIGIIIVPHQLKGAAIDYFMLRFTELGSQLLLQLEASVVTGDSNAHDEIPGSQLVRLPVGVWRSWTQSHPANRSRISQTPRLRANRR